jgi:acyl carrier protein
MAVPSFEQFAAFIREFNKLSPKIVITTATRFEKDLGITGDDGGDLLKEVEKHFGVQLSSRKHGVRHAFKLKPNENLFHSEGTDLLGFFRSESEVLPKS